MTRLVRAGSIAVAVAAAATGLAAQQAAPPPVFRASADLITVDALVTDSKGNVVTGLTAKDFQIVEKGRPQTIAAFSYVSVPLVERKEFDPVPVTPMRDIVTNVVAPHSRAYTIVVDDLHLLEQHAELIRRVLTDLLGSIPTNDRVAVIFTGRSDLSVDLTDDRAAQLQAVGRVHEALGFALDAMPVACGVKEAQRKHQALGALDVLRNVATVMAGTRADERTLVYVSEGFNFDFSAMPYSPVMAGIAAQQKGTSLSEEIEHHCSPDGLPLPANFSTSPLPGNPQENPADAGLIRKTLLDILETARRSDVRAYTMDPRGNLPVDAEVRGDVFEGAGSREGVASKVTVQNDFLRTVASETGGRAAVQRSDMHGAVRELLADTSSYYLLGYSPTPIARDGLFHDIDVKVLRPGLHIRARKGYTAPDANAATLTGARALSTDLAGSDVTRDLTLAGFIAPIAPAADQTRAALTLEVIYPGPSAVPAKLTDDLQLQVIDGGVEGKGRVISTRAFHFGMTSTRPGDVAFLVNDVIDLPPGVTNLRVGLLSKTTGRVGTVAMPVRVPNLMSGALQIAGMVIGLGGANSANVAGEAAMPADAFTGLVPFQPILRRVFTPADTLRVFAAVSWGDGPDAVSVTLSVTGPGNPLSQTSIVRAPAGSGLRRGVVDLTVPLAAIAPGEHVLTLQAVVGGGQPVVRTVGFRVVPR